MLVISRKPGESFLIGDNIRINIVSSSNDKITIAIDAPKEIKIIREELMETIQANQESNIKMTTSDYQDMANILKSKKTL
jgi:carbon storage regulator